MLFGPDNLGDAGINGFLQKHSCSAWCHRLGLKGQKHTKPCLLFFSDPVCDMWISISLYVPVFAHVCIHAFVCHLGVVTQEASLAQREIPSNFK